MKFLFLVQNYDGEKWLSHCLSSVVAVMRSAVALGHEAQGVVMDACSEDKSLEIVAQGFPEFAVLSHPRLNQAAACNAALWRYPDFDFFNVVNNDDALLPAFVPAHTATAAREKADFYHGNCIFFDEDTGDERLFRGHAWEETFARHQNGCAHPTFLIPRATIEKYGYFDESITHPYDFEFSTRIYSRGGKIAHTDVPVAWYRWRQGQGTKIYGPEVIREHNLIVERHLQ